MKTRPLIAIAMLGASFAACQGDSSQTSTGGPPGESTGPLADRAPAGCALLDDSGSREQMSAAFELKLLRKCGRELPRLSARELSQAAPDVPESLLMSLSEGFAGTDVLVNNPAADVGGHTTQSETSTVAVGSVVCVAWNDAGEGFGANGFAGFGYSLDGGQTFTDGGPFPNGTSDASGGDPSLAYSARDGAFYFASLSDLGLSLWKSATNCQTFQYVGPIHSGSGDDKELMAVDNTPSSPHYGRIYVGWTNFSAYPNYNMVTSSDDGGATWSAPAPLPGSGTSGQGMYPAVAPNGDVYFALLNRAGSVGGLQDQWIFKSTDGGASFVKMTNIGSGQLRPENSASSSTCGRQALNGNVRNLSSPQIAITLDAAAPAGYVVHSVYPYDSDGAGADQSNVFYRRSVDGAATWSAEVKLNDDGTSTDQFFPALGVGETGVVVASWYDRRNDPTGNLNFDRYVAYSLDGGLTWSANQRISDLSSGVAQTKPNFDGLASCYHGDYDQVAVSESVAHVVWSDDRRVTSTGPNPDVYYDRLAIGNALAVSPSTFEGGSAATGTVTLQEPAPASGLTVLLSSSVPTLVLVPASVVVPASAKTATFSIDSFSTLTQTSVAISATFPDATTTSTNVTVLASPTPARVTLSPASLAGGQPATATVMLSQPAPAGGSVLALASNAPAVASVPATLSIDEGRMTGTFVVTTSAQATDTTAQISASLNGITKSATLWVLSAAGNATYDATLKVPRCTAASSYCDTGPDLVRGRGAILGGVETNAPNTLAGTCADGSAGMFHYDESLDRLKISTVDGTALAAGKQVNVEATVWIYSGNDHLDIFFAPDANAPVWALVSTVTVTASQSQRILNASFALPEATLPAIRAQWRYGGSGVPCAAGIYNDRDDLVFTYGTGADTTPPTVAITSPASGTAVRTVVPVSIDAEDDVGIASVVLAVDGSKAAETVGTAPYQIPLVTPNYPDGPHDLTAIAMDGAGNVTVSSAVSLVFDNTSPSVVIVTPAPGSIVSGIVAVGANATDATSGVAVVEFLVDGVILGSDATAPYSLDWNTTSVTTGDHVLTARATDRAGNQMGSLPVTVTVTIENQPPVVDAGPDLVVNLADEAALNGSVTDDGLPAPPALVIAWTVTSGPGIVTFTDPAAATTTARFTAAGTYVLRLSASDGALSADDEVQVVVNAANTPPVVDAGPDLSVGLSSAAVLEGSVTDDGLPAPPALTIVWTMTSGPGTVTFADPSAASTTATFSAAGVYVLRLSASDGALSAFDETQVTVSVENQAPVVNAGPDRAVTFPAVATLDGTATDDGLPAPAILAILWTKVSGPGTVTFANPNEAATTASFDAVGTYVLRLTADDGELSSSDDVQVTVSAQNQAPVVDAGPDLTVTLPATLPINGTVTDDGLPAPPNLSITWTKISGPGTVTFTPANAAATTASFSAAGTYVLRLSASDGALSSSDEVQVTVSPANTAPVVNAGPDRTVTLPSTLTINGTVTDDGLPAPPTLTITWSQTSGPGTVTFSPVGAATTTASFSAAGTYVLRLTASDGALSSSDEVQVVVSGTGSSPCAGLCSNPVNFTIGSNYQSGNLGTGAGCYQTTSVIHGGNCGNFTSPRTLSVNGTQETCTYTNWSSIPATRNGGYCIQITAGNYSWAYFSLW